MKYYIGIDLGGTFVKAGVVDENYQIVAKAMVPSADAVGDPELVADRMVQCAREALEKAGLTMDDADSIGVGKSETAIELVTRGHRLIADDAVEIRRVSNKSLVGTSPENIRHFVELRGIGIINARRLFGMGAVKTTEKIDMVVRLEHWDPNKTYDRMGIENEYISILGNRVPCLTIPVKPGRNLAVILEVAAMNNRQKKMGYNAAQELLKKLGMPTDGGDIVKDWDF